MDKHEKFNKFGALMGEFTFGLTHRTFTVNGVEYAFSAHEMQHLVMGIVGGVESLSVMNSAGDIETLTTDQAREVLKEAYKHVLEPRTIEFAINKKLWLTCETDEEIKAFDPKLGWSYRADAMKRIDEENQKNSIDIESNDVNRV